MNPTKTLVVIVGLIRRSYLWKWDGIAVTTLGTNPLASIKLIVYNGQPTGNGVPKVYEWIIWTSSFETVGYIASLWGSRYYLGRIKSIYYVRKYLCNIKAYTFWKYGYDWSSMKKKKSNTMVHPNIKTYNFKRLPFQTHELKGIHPSYSWLGADIFQRRC